MRPDVGRCGCDDAGMSEKLKKARQAKGLTIDQAAELMGISRSQYHKLELGERQFREKYVVLAAQAFGVDPAELIDSATPLNQLLETTRPHVGKALPFAGYVAAGLWHPVDDLDQDGLEVPDFVLSHPAYPKARQYAYMVRGDSMNLAGIDDGMWVVAADAGDFVDLYGETESGDLVVVERSRFQGSERELTVKEIRFYRDRYELLPRSSNPAHQPIVVPHNHGVEPGKEEVRVIGVVLTSYRDHRRRK